MRIEELHLKNFRCFKELDIQFPESNLAVFIGLNGAGKSAILDAIIKAISDALKSPIVVTPQNKIEKKIKYTSGSSPDILISESYYELSIVLTYPPSFTLMQYTAARQKIKPINNPSSKSLKGFDDFKKWFIEEESRERRLQFDKKSWDVKNDKLEIIRKAIEIFCSNISNMKVNNLRTKDIGNTNLVVDWNGLELRISQLSEGQRNLLFLISDIAFSLLNYIEVEIPDGFFDKPNTILNRNGIVLIDEIELHLHPQWQREVLPALQKTFPNIQFIVTTHSPQVLSNLKKEEVFILKDNKIVEVTPHIEGRDANSILYELFGVEERPERFKNQLKQLYNAIDDENLSKAKEILAELTTAFGEQDTEIVRANLHLSFAEE